MKRILPLIAAILALSACSPVLNRELMDQGTRDAPFSLMRETPGAYKGKLFILGGVIVNTRFTEKGSEIEALSVPVDSLGYLKDRGSAQGRFLAVYPRGKGLLDPMVYAKGREITLAGAFVEARKGKLDEMEYTYPVFEIRGIYLWEDRREYHQPDYYPFYYPYYNHYPFWYDRWGRPYYDPSWPLPPW